MLCDSGCYTYFLVALQSNLRSNFAFNRYRYRATKQYTNYCRATKSTKSNQKYTGSVLQSPSWACMALSLHHGGCGDVASESNSNGSVGTDMGTETLAALTDLQSEGRCSIHRGSTHFYFYRCCWKAGNISNVF